MPTSFNKSGLKPKEDDESSPPNLIAGTSQGEVGMDLAEKQQWNILKRSWISLDHFTLSYWKCS